MKPTRLDRFFLAIAPKYGLNRMRARAAADIMTRHYDAAAPSRRTNGWQRNFGDADLNIRWALVELRNHARDLMRNNAWARNAQRVVADNTVGWGIKAKATGKTAERAAQLWKAWAETTECESEGRHTFYGIQHLAMRSIVESGEVILRRRWRKAKDNLTLPLQVQILEADYLDHSKMAFDSQAGGPIITGVEFDKIGRRAAYWLFDKHPGSGRNYNPSKRTPADDVIHVFYPERPGQSRGVSWLAPAILNLKDFDEYEDAELMRQKIAACFAAFVTDIDGNPSLLGAPGDPNGNANQLTETLEPGTVVNLPIGKNIAFASPPQPVNGDFTERTLRRIAKAIGVTYEDLTGDYSQSNFSSARMSRISHWGHVHDWQWNMLIPQLCDGLWKWAMDGAMLAGEIGAPAEVSWVAPPMPMIEPDKEGLAYQRLIRNGLMSLSDAIREQGLDPDVQFAEIAADNATLDKLKIILDSDPRKTTAQGQGENLMHKDAPGAEKPPPAKGA